MGALNRWPAGLLVFGNEIIKTRDIRLLLLACAFVLVATGTAADQPPKEDPELLRLNKALDAAVSQADMNIASRKIMEFWEAKLASVEKQTVVAVRSNEAQRIRFTASQKQWRSYRNCEVEFESGFEGKGTIQPLVAGIHYARITERRVKEPEALLVGLNDE